MKYFVNITDLNELRKEYYRLALIHHPDRGGDLRTMQEINTLYEKISKQLINNSYTGERAKQEENTIYPFAEMIARVFNLKGVNIEIIGSWIWLTGETKQYKEYLKEIGFKFSGSKIAWYWHHGTYVKFNKVRYDLNEIRKMWGSQTVKTDGEELESKKLTA